MCMAACCRAGIEAVVYASTNADALKYDNFNDSVICQELTKPGVQRSIPSRQFMQAEAIAVWKQYRAKTDRVPY